MNLQYGFLVSYYFHTDTSIYGSMPKIKKNVFSSPQVMHTEKLLSLLLFFNGVLVKPKRVTLGCKVRSIRLYFSV